MTKYYLPISFQRKCSYGNHKEGQRNVGILSNAVWMLLNQRNKGNSWSHLLGIMEPLNEFGKVIWRQGNCSLCGEKLVLFRKACECTKHRRRLSFAIHDTDQKGLGTLNKAIVCFFYFFAIFIVLPCILMVSSLSFYSTDAQLGCSKRMS